MKVILVMAMTADGYITKHTDGLVDWTSKEDKKHFSKITKDTGVVIYGRKTFSTFNKPLPGRLNIILTRTPQDYANRQEADLLEFTNQEPQILLDTLEQRGYKQVAIAGGSAVNKMFLSLNLIDEIYLTIEPKVFGSGKRLFDDLQKDINLELIDHSLLNKDSVLLHYKVKR